MARRFLLTTLTCFAGCMGTGERGGVDHVELKLSADETGALLKTDCLRGPNPSLCRPYPNHLGCTSMVVYVSKDVTRMKCMDEAGDLLSEGEYTVADGSPFVASWDSKRSCGVVRDIYGYELVSNCGGRVVQGRGGQRWSNASPVQQQQIGGGQSSVQTPTNVAGEAAAPTNPGGQFVHSGQPVAAQGTSQSGQTGTTSDQQSGEANTQTGGNSSISSGSASATTGGEGESSTAITSAYSDRCLPQYSREKYFAEFNRILGMLGLEHLVITRTQIDNPEHEVPEHEIRAWVSRKHDLCVRRMSFRHTKWMNQCINEEDANNPACFTVGGQASDARWTRGDFFCNRITGRALAIACQSVPISADLQSDCSTTTLEDRMRHIAKIIVAHGEALQRLLGLDGYTDAGKSGQAPIQCNSSPLVLDLDGDGVAPTSVDQGVIFDLEARGNIRTAWLSGQDALLTYDRNGNGTIDNGTELFGTATPVDGWTAENGFAALNEFDSNHDGVVDADDLLYSELRLWNDRNRNGVSEASELSQLSKAGVRSLHVMPIHRQSVIDSYGNDIGLRSVFTRTDGSRGELVDVFFSTRRLDH